MQSITLNSNVASLNAQRRLVQSTRSLADSFTRLSSGLRINRAADDAAGLAIAESLKTDQRVFNQGVRNLNDGVSLLSIADSALGELSGIAIRLTELAEQAANGALSNTQRNALDEEAQALKAEYFRISKTTEFNGVKLFDGSFGDLRLQAGFGERGGIVSGLGGRIGTGDLEAATTFGVGSNPTFVDVADFNGDGRLDLVTTNTSDDTLSVLLGDGTGGFAPPTSAAVGNGAIALSAGDFDGDGVLDIATADYGDDTITLLLGRGDGSFEFRASYAVGSNPNSIDTADLNGDGVLDLVTANLSDNTVSVNIGRGDGSFFTTTSFSVGNGPRSVTTGDFNSDGTEDIAVTDETDGTISILIGLGDGSFAPRVSYATGDNPFSLITEDVNGDGKLDLAVADGGSATVSVLLGRGDGSFAARTSFAVGANPFTISTGDFNGDGVLDLITSDAGSSSLSVLLGQGDGSYAPRSSYTVGNTPFSVAAGDIDGDGVLDVIAANYNANSLSVLSGATTDGVAPLLSFTLRTLAGARQALPALKGKIAQLAGQRGEIGAFEARLSTAIVTTRVATQNFASARSQIEDADVAVEAARLVRSQILQQAGAAILAQSNQGPGLALTLLGRS